ncbi:MAG: riboflavin biosynthesis protein RibF [Cardiobacteriaceae bacterium]|nr:riboflavin biosynthesis protein RibF [Cardiobacteriaceae bacterium]
MKISKWQSGFHLPQSSSVVIGNFDGVHRGHQKMLARCCEIASEKQLLATAVSFFPHTKILTRGENPCVISNLADRAFYLAEQKISDWVLMSFNQKLRQTSAEDFVKRCLLTGLQAKFVIVGEDFRFGYQGQGTAEKLAQFGEKYGFAVEIIPAVCEENQRISSSKIRELLQEKNIATAAKMLGHFPSFIGTVKAGAGRGKKLDARTANLHIPQNWAVADGVYALEVEILASGEKFQAVANVGSAPTFHSARRKIEAHLLDVERDLYGQKLKISVEKFLRNIVKFDNFSELQKQISLDIAAARQFFDAESKTLTASMEI